MPEPINATVPSQQVEQPAQVPTPTPVEVATPEPVVVAQGQETGQEPKALTEQQVLDLIEKRATEIAQKQSLEAIRQAQSLTDKLDARLNKEFENRLKAIESATGIQLTEAQKYALQRQTAEQLKAEEAPQETPVQQPHPLMADVKRIADKYDGTIITSQDPEYGTVNVDGTWGEWQETYERAVKAKVSRLAPKQTPSVEESNANPEGRIAKTPVSKTGGLPDNLPAIDYFKQALSKK